MTDRKTTEPTLLPCPFCGGAPRKFNCVEGDGFVSGTFVRCDECGIDINDEYESGAIEAWNRRAASPAAPGAEVEPVAWIPASQIDELRELAGGIDLEYWFTKVIHAYVLPAEGRIPVYLSPPTTDAIRAQARREALEEAAAWHDDQAALHDAQGEACGMGSDGWKRHTVAAADHRRSATSIRAIAGKGEAE